MATATFAHVAYNAPVAPVGAGIFAALRNLFVAPEAFDAEEALRSASHLGPEQLKEMGAVQDFGTGRVFATFAAR